VTAPSQEPPAPPRPELDRLHQYIEGIKRAWEHEVPTMEALAAQAGYPRIFLQEVVQEYFWRAVSHAEGIHTMLDRRLGIPAVPIIRSLYEAHLAFVYLHQRTPKDRAVEAQVAFAHHPYHVRYEIAKGIQVDEPGGRMLEEANEDIARCQLEMQPEAIVLAEKRQGSRSWTGQDVRPLVEKYAVVNDEYKDLYGMLSTLAHGHHALVSLHIMNWPPEEYERYARDTHVRLRDIRMRMQDILNLRFSDAAIDEFRQGETLLVHLPHASMRSARP
jgi:hypothetical protein